MTRRLYYTDMGLRRFDAVVTSCTEVEGRLRVVLDRTAFYPSSGGQPFDTGHLGGVAVVDVLDREDGAIEHVVPAPLAVGSRVTGEIDWPRRFDHMQQHTGQHVLSAAFERACGASTVSFHLGTEVSTIDLDREVTPAGIDVAEEAANLVSWDDRPVSVRVVSADEASHLPLRKPPARGGELRLVEIRDFDLSACGGTHVSATGAIGLIGVTGWERRKGGMRVSFVCGGRALRSHRRLRDVVGGACRRLSIVPDELDAQIARLQQGVREAERRTAILRDELVLLHAGDWRRQGETIGPHLVVLRHEPSIEAAALKQIALAVAAVPGTVAALVGGGWPVPVVVARGEGVDLDAAAVVRWLTTELGGRGGGRPEMAQAGVAAGAEAIVTFLRQALGAPAV